MEISDKSSNKSTTSEAEVVTGMCTGNTNPSFNIDCSATNQQDIANYSTTPGTDSATCCEDITGMWTGNTDGSSVDCNVTNQQDIANYATTAGTDATTCCEGYGLRGMWILGNQGDDCNQVCSDNGLSCLPAPVQIDRTIRDYGMWATGTPTENYDNIIGYIRDNTYTTRNGGLPS